MEDLDNYTYLCSRLTLQSASEGFFKDLLRKVIPHIDISLFSVCRSDFERITVCAKYCWHLIGAELIFKGKDPEIALAKRVEGNNLFEKQEFQKALLMYSQSIIRCPVGPDLAITYANRSALLKNMGEWQFAINDVKMALSHGYPEHNWHTVYERMAACHLNLKEFSQAKIAINLCKQLVSKYAAGNEKLNKRIEKLSARIVSNEGSTEISPPLPVPAQSTSTDKPMVHNLTFPGFSEKIDVQFSEEQGRYAYAKTDIFSCDRVVEEKPYASCLLSERMGSWCLHCFTRLRAPIACDLCCNVAFCSKSCKQKSEAYHRYECRISALLIGSGMSIVCHLALRIITQSSAASFLEKFTSLQSNPNQIHANNGGKYDSFDYGTIYNLSALETARKPHDFLERTIMAVFLMRCLRVVGYYEDLNLFKNPEPTLPELQIGSLILRNLQIIQFNAYEIHEFIRPNTDNFRKVSSINLGIGLYPTSAFLNHSCAPNVTRYFKGTTLLIDSLERIEAGCSISDNYGPIFIKMSKQERLTKLFGRYWFQCSCSACKEDWPALEGMPLEMCPANRQEKSILKQLDQLGETYYEKALQMMDTGHGRPAVELLRIYLDKASSLVNCLSKVNKPFKTFHLAQEALKLCLPERAKLIE